MKKWIIRAVPAVFLAAASLLLLKNDVWIFWTWWLLAALLGMLAMPLTGTLFRSFEDKGWLFSKVLAIALTGFLTWFLVAVGIIRFTMGSCLLVVAVFGGVCLWGFGRQSSKGLECFLLDNLRLVYWEELLFFGIFLLWTYLAGFNPAAYGTEKFMDYGFMEAMMRSTELPAVDLWYSQGHINYYYGGQYFAVFLTKLSGGQVALTYNLMRTFVAAFAYVLPFSLVYQMAADRMQGRLAGRKERTVPVLAGLTAGFAVSIAGNMHYIIYGKVIPIVQRLSGQEPEGSYWFPDATRYIGFNPDVPDKTIHEFPCYSFVLGDLHAHVVNIMFVLLLLGLLYAWTQKMRMVYAGEEEGRKFLLRQLCSPHLLLGAWLLGMFQWTNFWDFVIYYVVMGGTVLFTNIVYFRGKVRRILGVTALEAVEVLAVSYLIILPFTLKFETMVQGVAAAQNHSLLHQLLVLWGLPVFLTVLYLLCILWEKLKGMEKKSLYRLLEATEAADLFAVVMGLCAIGLVLIPEFVYVRDIYENGNARANTMFKLTYQAFIMFGMVMGYVICRMVFTSRQKFFKVLSLAGLFLLLCTGGYFGNSVHSWFGEVWKPSGYKGLDATAYIETDFPEDAPAIRWLKDNIKGSPVVLEANGDSYTAFERVSAMTGLPTVLGWYVHEWLWRNDVGDLNQKSADIETIYTSQDGGLVRQLILDYDISYIFVGAREAEKYGDRLNRTLLRSMGTPVFEDEISGTFILKVS